MGPVMTHHELETLINSTNFTDDIDRNLFLMAMAEHDAEIDEAREKEYKKPAWIDLARGFTQASEEVTREAVKIYGEFCRFKYAKAETLQELVEAFTLAKLNNKIRS